MLITIALDPIVFNLETHRRNTNNVTYLCTKESDWLKILHTISNKSISQPGKSFYETRFHKHDDVIYVKCWIFWHCRNFPYHGNWIDQFECHQYFPLLAFCC